MKAKNIFHCFLILLFIVSFISNAQTSKIDSLQFVIKNSSEDTNKVAAMKAMSRELWQQRRMNSALLYEEYALALNNRLVIDKEIEEAKNEIKNEMNSKSDDLVMREVSFSNKDSSTHLLDRITKIEAEQIKLGDAIKEFNRRSLSLSDDRVVEMQNKNQLLALEQEAALQHLIDEKSKRNWIVFTSVIILLLLSFVFYQIYKRRRTKYKLELQKLNNKVLRSQLNPHFIFHALDSIRTFMKLHPEKADEYLIKFSTLMRQVLENSEEDKISLAEELSMLKNYMQLEAIRITHGFDCEFNLEKNLEVNEIMVPPLIFQPIIENAIIHGLMPLAKRGKILLQFKEINGLLEVKITDNGIGMSSMATESFTANKKRSMGIQITRDRIELLNRKMKRQGIVHQELFEQGSTVSIIIPV